MNFYIVYSGERIDIAGLNGSLEVCNTSKLEQGCSLDTGMDLQNVSTVIYGLCSMFSYRTRSTHVL